MIIINTKNYKTGPALLKLARLIEQNHVRAALAVPATDLGYLSHHSNLTIYAQHVDPTTSEKSTGHVSVESLHTYGATGTLLNHSEHPLSIKEIKQAIEQLKKKNMTAMVCAKSLAEVKKIIPLKPTGIAFEDPSLIGTGKAITTHKAKALRQFIDLVKDKPSMNGWKIIPICGAGISSVEDINAAYAMGCGSVLVASAIAASKNPSSLLKQIHKWQQETGY
jgi:triosephosphate isomerase